MISAGSEFEIGVVNLMERLIMRGAPNGDTGLSWLDWLYCRWHWTAGCFLPSAEDPRLRRRILRLSRFYGRISTIRVYTLHRILDCHESVDAEIGDWLAECSPKNAVS